VKKIMLARNATFSVGCGIGKPETYEPVQPTGTGTVKSLGTSSNLLVINGTNVQYELNSPTPARKITCAS
jgi:hypothetical protein